MRVNESVIGFSRRSLSFFKALEMKAAPTRAVSASTTRRVALAATLVGLAVVLSPLYFPVGDTKCFPAQHMVNALAGILLGPWYAVFIAIATGTIRIATGMGTVFAYPGGIFGGLVVGLTYRYVRKVDYSALLEPVGTVAIGATLSALVVAPYIGKTMTLIYFWTAFAASSIPGAVLGFIVLKTLRRAGIDRYFD
jgi:energy coupling factor transporter S component ThiW